MKVFSASKTMQTCHSLRYFSATPFFFFKVRLFTTVASSATQVFSSIVSYKNMLKLDFLPPQLH